MRLAVRFGCRAKQRRQAPRRFVVQTLRFARQRPCHAERNEASGQPRHPGFLPCRAQRSLRPARPQGPAMPRDARRPHPRRIRTRRPQDPLSCGLSDSRDQTGCHLERSDGSVVARRRAQRRISARCRPRQTEGLGTPQVPAPLSLRILPRQASSTGVGRAASAVVAQSGLVRAAPVSRIGVVRQIPAGPRVTTRSGCRRRAHALPRDRSRRCKTQSPARVMRPTSSEPVISPPR